MSGGNGGVLCRPWSLRGADRCARAFSRAAPAAGIPAEKSKCALTAPASLFEDESAEAARPLAAAGVPRASVRGMEPPRRAQPRGRPRRMECPFDDFRAEQRGGGVRQRRCDDRYGVFLFGKGLLVIAPGITNLLYYLHANKETPRDPFGRDQIAPFQRGCAH